MLQNHAGLKKKDQFKLQDRPMEFNGTECKIFIDMI